MADVTSHMADVAASALELPPAPCESRSDALAAFARVYKAFAEGRPVPLSDVARYRACSNQCLEQSRYWGVTSAKSSLQQQLPDALLKERDDWMGWELARLAASHKTVVAVVGASHMPGVRAQFALCTLLVQINAEGKARFHDISAKRAEIAKRFEAEALELKQMILSMEQQTEPPKRFELPALKLTMGRAVGAAAVRAGGCAFAWRSKRPLRMVPLYAGGLTAVVGGVQLGLAGLTARWTQFGAYLDAATRSEEEGGK